LTEEQAGYKMEEQDKGKEKNKKRESE